MRKRKPDLRARALKAYRLFSKNITGEELAARLKLSVEAAIDLAQVGALIVRAEDMRLTQPQWDVLKVIARAIARNVMLGRDWAKTSDVDFAGGKRSGWCMKRVPALVAAGLIVMPQPMRLTLSRAGWAYVFEAKLILSNWRVPS